MNKEEKDAYNKRYFQKHKSDIYAKNKTRIAERRKRLHVFVEELKHGKVCQRCGVADSRLLEFRYKEEATGKGGNLKNKAISMNWSEKRIAQELEQCSLLCLNCRKLFSSEDG